jgi:hypothetical protein
LMLLCTILKRGSIAALIVSNIKRECLYWDLYINLWCQQVFLIRKNQAPQKIEGIIADIG